MTTRHTLLALLGAGLMFATPAVAKPHHHHGAHVDVAIVVPQGQATLEIDNRFDGPVQVWIDGRLETELPANRRSRISSRPGTRTVMLTTRSGYVLRTDRLHLSNRSTTLLALQAPLTPLRVTNPSSARLQVTVAGTQVWVSPHTTVELSVPAGNVQLVATAPGDPKAHTRSLWVEPGRRASTTLDYTPPTRFHVVNVHPHPIRIVVDGRDVLTLQPSSSRWLDVSPGLHAIQIFDGRRLIQSETLRFSRGDQHKIVSHDNVTRPAPPPRLSSAEVEICPVTGRPISVASR